MLSPGLSRGNRVLSTMVVFSGGRNGLLSLGAVIIDARLGGAKPLVSAPTVYVSSISKKKNKCLKKCSIVFKKTETQLAVDGLQRPFGGRATCR